MKPKIKLLVVDLYGVISLGSYRDICRYVAKKYKLPYKKTYNIFYHKYFSAAALGQISEADSFKLALKELNIKAPWQSIRQRHYKNIVKINKPALELIKKLRLQGYKVLLLSKNTTPQFRYTIKVLRLKKYFKNIVNTLDLGLPKASKQTMLWVFKKFKVKAGEVIFIDDQGFNLPQAKKLGVNTIHYKDLSQLSKKLKNLLV